MTRFALFVLFLVALVTNAQVEERADITTAAEKERKGFVEEAEALRDQLDEFLRLRLATKREKMKLGIRRANVYTSQMLDSVSSYLSLDGSSKNEKKGGKGTDSIEGLTDLKVEFQDAIQEVKNSELGERVV